MTHEYIGTKIVTAWPQEKDGQQGYGVKYSDGYISWSPAAAFEEAYTDIGHVAHLPPHQQRVIGEKAQLEEKLGKLSLFLGTPNFAQLEQAERQRLEQQVELMRGYASILGDRINAFTAN